MLGEAFLVEERQAVASAAAGKSLLAPAVFFDDDRDRQLYQRPHVGGQHAVTARHQHHVIFSAEVGHDLLDPRVTRPRELFDMFEQPDLRGGIERRDRIVTAVERDLLARCDLRRHARFAAALTRNRSRRQRRFGQRCRRDVVRIRESGPIARNRAHADALFDVEAAALDNAFFERKRLVARVLEVQVGVIGAVLEDCREHLLQAALVEFVRVEQQRLGGGQAVERGVGKLHA